jgi:glycosyltransferase involved in cell wall biosynthesis
MSHNPLVSIILPTYNGSRFIEDSINSCIAQTYLNWELIIVDDASTDRTPEIVSKYVALDKRIKSVRHQTNRKLPGALNTGFAAAKGTYFTWTSDDNCYRTHAIREMVQYLESHHDVDMVYCDFMLIDDNGNETRLIEVCNPEDLLEANGVGACFLYKNKLHKKLGGYSEHLFLAEDYDFWLRASIHFKLRPLHNNLYLYRQHNNSLTNQQIQKVDEVVEKVLLNILPEMPYVEGSTLAKVYMRLSHISRGKGNCIQARSYFYKALNASLYQALLIEIQLRKKLLIGSFISIAVSIKKAFSTGKK